MKLVWFFAVFLMFFIGGTVSYPTEKRCGEKLMKLLSTLCNKVYYEPQKKSVLDIIYPNKKPHFQFEEYENDFSDNLLDDYQNWPYFKSSSPSLSNIFNRNRRGIVDECCKAPCTTETLLLYCGK
ncbi:bombyxin C-1-like [Anthonomus grandis grandis]|uniref:bombyxin C-1-like n=1 Tax=Anthonomus grandis grandis TaxID=2921223 RepID=UPI0021662FFC|nr:bombyxin C-1-like [Anthonomus grandis grandis]